MGVSAGKSSLSIKNRGVNTRHSSGMLVRVLSRKRNSYWRAETPAISSLAPRSGPTLSIPIQLRRCLPCRRCQSRRVISTQRRRAAHPGCQGVTSTACTRNLIPAVSPTCPACPSISAIVTASATTRVHFRLVYTGTSTLPSGGGLRFPPHQNCRYDVRVRGGRGGTSTFQMP